MPMKKLEGEAPNDMPFKKSPWTGAFLLLFTSCLRW